MVSPLYNIRFNICTGMILTEPREDFSELIVRRGAVRQAIRAISNPRVLGRIAKLYEVSRRMRVNR